MTLLGLVNLGWFLLRAFADAAKTPLFEFIFYPYRTEYKREDEKNHHQSEKPFEARHRWAIPTRIMIGDQRHHFAGVSNAFSLAQFSTVQTKEALA